MNRFVEIPQPLEGAYGQPDIMRFGKHDRIVMRGYDYKVVTTNVLGHLFRPVVGGDDLFRSHADMPLESRHPGYRHDRDWYDPKRMKARKRAGVSFLSELDQADRELFEWKAAFCLEFLKLEREHPDEKLRGGKIEWAIGMIDRLLRNRMANEQDAGRRRRGGRRQNFFDKPGPKALLVWIKLLEDGGYDPLVLCDQYGNSGWRNRLQEEVVNLIKEFARQYLQPKAPPITKLHRDLAAHIRKLNLERTKARRLKVPHYSTLYRAVTALRDFDKCAAREGIGRGKSKFKPYGKGFEALERPLQYVEMDHWTVNIRVLMVKARIWDQLTPKQRAKVMKARWTLGVAICRLTKVLLGMVLSPTASTDNTVRLIEMMVADKAALRASVDAITPYDIHGTPENVVSDSGSAINNAPVRRRLRDLGINYETPPSGVADLRGTIERLFGTIDLQCVAGFSGRTFANIMERGEYDSDAHAGTVLEELGRALVRYFIDAYHNTPRDELGGETPRSLFHKLAARYPIMPSPDWHRMRMVFGLDLSRKNRRGGIRVMGVQYRSRALHQMFLQKRNEPLVVRCHPANMGAISVKAGRGEWLSVATDRRFEGVTLRSWIAALTSIRTRKREMQEITDPIRDEAFAELERLVKCGEERLGIDVPSMTLKQIARAEREFDRFAKYPDEEEPARASLEEVFDQIIEVGPGPAGAVEPAASPEPAGKSRARRRARSDVTGRSTGNPRPALAPGAEKARTRKRKAKPTIKSKSVRKEASAPTAGAKAAGPVRIPGLVQPGKRR